MSNQKLKVENYQNFGGINSKFSPHLVSPMEFMDIKNFDFQTPGCLTQRWGSTQYMGQTLSGKITALSEFQKLNGASYVIAGCSGGMWFGATTGNFQGMSFTNVGQTISLSTPTMVISPAGVTTIVTNGAFRSMGFAIVGASSLLLEQGAQGIFYQGTSLQNILNGSPNGTNINSYTIPACTLNGNYASIAYLVDFAFIANGNAFVKFDGATTTPVGVPLPVPVTLISNYDDTGMTNLLGYGGTGAALFYVSYVNNRGFESPILPLVSSVGFAVNSSNVIMNPSGMIGMTLVLNTPLNFGISTINVYSYCVQGASNFSRSINQVLFSDSNTWNYPFVKLNSFSVSGSTLTAIPLGTTRGNFSQIYNNIGALPNSYINQYQTIGFTLGAPTAVDFFGNDSLTNFGSIQGYGNPYNASYFPQFLAVYDNRLFSAGYSSTPSTVWFSDVKEPEGYLPTNNFEVRTNDSDYITSITSYQTRLYIFKRNSFHVLVGDNPANFFIQEVSNLYGCLNNRCAVLFDDVMLFLDRKGVFQYNGANLVYVSPKVQPIFDRMNYNAALSCACGSHDKIRNQILFAIPIDGSTTNNITIVYDYITQAWTYHTGYNANIFAEIQGYNNTKQLFYGDYNGRVNYFGASFLSDNGVGYTLSFKTRYLHDMGDSTQKQFRRLYINADQMSATLSNNINFYQDYGTSIVLATTLNLGTFQERIDYGISAKSLAYEFITQNTTTSPLKIHGFTVESRLQRKV